MGATLPLVARAPRPSPTGPTHRYAGLDGLRGIAALVVVFAHCVEGYVPARPGFLGLISIPVGELSVAIFFALSGFLLYQPYVLSTLGDAPWPSLRSFYTRRFLRTTPAYWVALTLVAFLPDVAGVFSRDGPLLYAYGQVYQRHTTVMGIGPAWTLCVEFTFYLLLPALALGLRALHVRTQRVDSLLWVLGLAGLGSFAVAGLVRVDSPMQFLAVSLPGTFGWLGLGMALALVEQSFGADPMGALRRRVARYGQISLLAMVPLIAGVTAIRGPLPSGHSDDLDLLGRIGERSGLALAAGLIVSYLVLGPPGAATVRLLDRAIPTRIGEISYGIYLFHAPFVGLAGPSSKLASLPLTFVWVLLGVIAVSVVLGTLSFELVERPCMALGKRLNARERERKRMALAAGPTLTAGAGPG